MRVRLPVRAHGALFTAAVAAMLAAAGCGRDVDKVVDEALASRCVVVRVSALEKSGWQPWLDRHMKGAPRFPISQIDDAVSQCLREGSLLVIPGSDSLGADAEASLRDFLRQGGRALLCGLDVRTPAIPDESTYVVTSATLRIYGRDESMSLPARPMRCPFWTGNSLSASDDRYIGVAAALDPEGNVVGRPVTTRVLPNEDVGCSVTAWIGLNPEKEDDSTLIPLVEQSIAAATREIYLYHFGVRQHSARAGTPLTAHSSWIDRRDRDLSTVRFAVEWINARGLPVKRVVSTPLDPLVVPITLNIGFAPEPRGPAEDYTLRFTIRDRNDQYTYDTCDQPFKVFAYEDEARPEADFVAVAGNRLVHKRRPVFMLGVNYWPRHSAAIAARDGHWLDASNFDAETVRTDLNLMNAAGINAVTLECTTIEQAPQARYVLSELRNRGMWACVYIPALHPLDLRIDDAKRILEALDLTKWPEVFALEIARGIAIRPRAEMRVLDDAWADWIDEHFSSTLEAEQKLGIPLRKERGRLVGPGDTAIAKGPHRDRLVALYFTFLNDFVNRRVRYVRDWLTHEGYHTLITARSRYGWPSGEPAGAPDYLDISAGALHLDFLFPDAWSTHPLKSMPLDCNVLCAYAYGVSGGKPVLWSEYGQHTGKHAELRDLQRQKEVFKYFLDAFIAADSCGAFAWWYPPGTVAGAGHDWGVVNANGTWRPVEEIFRSARYGLRQSRISPRVPKRKPTSAILSASQWRDQVRRRTGPFSDSPDHKEINEWTLPGTGMTSMSVLEPGSLREWTEFDAFVLLNAGWGTVWVEETRQDHLPGENIRVYQGQRIELSLINTGSIRWEGASTRVAGTVWVRISQPGSAVVWLSSAALDRGETHKLLWIPSDTGLWEVQPYLVGYGRFGERLMVEVTSPPDLY